MKSLKTRINDLENQHPERPIKAIFQDFDNPNLWHLDPRCYESEALTWDEVEKRYPDHDFIQVTYTDDWRAIP